jgi:hypothetical protein
MVLSVLSVPPVLPTWARPVGSRHLGGLPAVVEPAPAQVGLHCAVVSLHCDHVQLLRPPPQRKHRPLLQLCFTGAGRQPV